MQEESSDAKGENNGQSATGKLTGALDDETKVHVASGADAGYQGLQGGVWSQIRSFVLCAPWVLVLLALLSFCCGGGLQNVANLFTSEITTSHLSLPSSLPGGLGTEALLVGAGCDPYINDPNNRCGTGDEEDEGLFGVLHMCFSRGKDCVLTLSCCPVACRLCSCTRVLTHALIVVPSLHNTL